ncbi:MAG: WxcM-like domain-containing protein [Legionella sp.]|nr:WxcM-like domain-containing protein [Legionella sp.]
MLRKNWQLFDLPQIKEKERGNLSFIEGGGRNIPFDIRRVYYLYDVPKSQERGMHGHKQLEQLFIAIAGSFEILLDSGETKENFYLDNPTKGLYVKGGTWREIRNFSNGAVCIILASDFYDEKDYLREYKSFLKFARSNNEKNL